MRQNFPFRKSEMFCWQTWILTVVAAVTIPLYVRILCVLIIYRRKYRFSSHFYTITISQWLVALPSWCLFVFQITMPIMLVANMFFIEMYFDAKSTMNVVISTYDLEIHYMKTVLVLLIATIICAVAYGILISTIRKSTADLRRKDIRMNIQAIGLLIALVITCIHFCAQYTFNKLGMTSTMYTTRLFTPLWIGMLTFINPWMILLMNKDLRRATLRARISEESTVRMAVFSQQKSRSMKMPNSYQKY
ncbi:hypothetical protein GCK32_000994 [Trichostrongylus colubriformis]|uniref:Serpentine receptor class gamma n=1 Tax=Trichostrongylus colubriformis TaxID=6319 RepID=A0AAN8FXH0_TRICO